MTILPKISALFNSFSTQSLSKERKELLDVLINHISEKQSKKEEIKLNFICTHNSRRSQFAQVWATVAAHFHRVDVSCYSGGTEATAFNERAISSLKRSGFRVSKEGSENPIYQIYFTEGDENIRAFSKIYNANENPLSEFAAIMTCSDADTNCPIIPGAEKRIPLLYNDPKEFDNTPFEPEKYDERSLQIASEMFYIFSKIKLHK